MEYSLDELIMMGAVEVAGVHENSGELLYNITEKAHDILPALYNKFMNQIHQKVMYFWEKGFLEFDDMSKENPNIRLTSKAMDDDELSKLSIEKLLEFQNLVSAFRIG
jgi:hypothetical protein